MASWRYWLIDVPATVTDIRWRFWLIVVTLGEASNHARGEERQRHRDLAQPVETGQVPTPLQELCRMEDAARLGAALKQFDAVVDSDELSRSHTARRSSQFMELVAVDD